MAITDGELLRLLADRLTTDVEPPSWNRFTADEVEVDAAGAAKELEAAKHFREAIKEAEAEATKARAAAARSSPRVEGPMSDEQLLQLLRGGMVARGIPRTQAEWDAVVDAAYEFEAMKPSSEAAAALEEAEERSYGHHDLTPEELNSYHRERQKQDDDQAAWEHAFHLADRAKRKYLMS